MNPKSQFFCTINRTVGVLLVFFLVLSCSEESRVKDMSLEEAERVFTSALNDEANHGVQGKRELKINYVSVIKNHTTYSVEKVEVSPQQALARLQIKTLDQKLRIALLGVIQKYEGENAFAFNVTDALSLVKKQMKPQAETQSVYDIIITFKKEGSSPWKAEPTNLKLF